MAAEIELPRRSLGTGGIIGAGAQGRVVAAQWRRAAPDAELFFIDDDPRLWTLKVYGVPVCGSVQALLEFAAEAPPVVVALGNNWTRTNVADRLRAAGIRFALVVDPSATILPDVQLGAGVVVGPGALVQIGAVIGDHAVINTGAIVEHDCVIEAGASVSPGVRMAGRVQIESHAFVGTGATLCPRVRIGAGAIVGAGAVVTRDVPPGSLVMGCPAKVVRQATAADWARLF